MPPQHLILVSSYTNEITTLSFDIEAKKLETSSVITVGHHPSWITPYPGITRTIFTGLEQSDGVIVVLRYDENGKGSELSRSSSGGRDPCSLLATEKELLVANYSSGNITITEITPTQPPSLVGSSLKTIRLHGSGPNKDRQEGSHPHQVIKHPETDELFVPDLGSDRVFRLKKNTTTGTWEPIKPIQFEEGGGPRHVAFYGGDMFTLLELSSKICRHQLPQYPALPIFVTSTPTMSRPPPTPNDMLAAEILIPLPNTQYPTPYIYVSNRNDPSPEGDIISIFSIEDPSKLELVAEVRTGLKHVRGIVFGGPDDRYLIAGGANGRGVKVFERVDGGKGLRVVAANDKVEAPTGFLWLN